MTTTLYSAPRVSALLGRPDGWVRRLARELGLGLRDDQGRLLGLTVDDIDVLRPLSERDRRGEWLTPEHASAMRRGKKIPKGRQKSS